MMNQAGIGRKSGSTHCCLAESLAIVARDQCRNGRSLSSRCGSAASNGTQPEPRHRVVVAVGVAVLSREVPDPGRDRLGCLREAKPADLDLGEAKVIPMMETCWQFGRTERR